jgi:hypothetical protein
LQFLLRDFCRTANGPHALLAPNVAEMVDHMGVIPGPDRHEVSVPPPHAPSLATDRADRHEGGSMNKKEAKWKKRKDRE